MKTNHLHPDTALFTDLYELTMAEGYFFSGKHEQRAVFDYFFRQNPFKGGYVVFCGLSDLLGFLSDFSFPPPTLEYLKWVGFKNEFLDYLRDFRFHGDIWSVPEGEVVFPAAPLVRVEGSLVETQLAETILLNTLNFQSLIATKASRIRRVAGDRNVMDFGLRRAQGLAGIHASRAAYIGGVDATSNVLAGYVYDIPVSGTMAHSWIQSFDSEIEAFRTYARIHPSRTILLVDTYDTLGIGMPNAITVAKEMREQGHSLTGIRLDSGDLAYLSKKAREMLDREGLGNVKIFASNQLDEVVIQSLNQQEAPIDGFGVGTKLITGQESAAIDGVYKLSHRNGRPWMKISENPGKVSLPGIKKLVRAYDDKDFFFADAVLLEEEEKAGEIYHPFQPGKHCNIGEMRQECLTGKVMGNGRPVKHPADPKQIREEIRKKINHLPEEYQRFENPHIYKLGISERLFRMREEMMGRLNSSNKTQ